MNQLVNRDQSDCDWLGIIDASWAWILWVWMGWFVDGDGLICSPMTTKRFVLKPGGSQVISMAVAGLSVTPKTETSVGFTISFL